MIWEDILEFENIYNPAVFAKIVLEWTTKNYQIAENIAVCENLEVCKINFNTEESTNVKKYLWNFDNWETFEWKNPKTIEFLPWKYKVSLKIFDI